LGGLACACLGKKFRKCGDIYKEWIHFSALRAACRLDELGYLYETMQKTQ